MRSLHRLSVVSIVSLAAIILCSTSAHAQTAAAPSIAPAPSPNATPFAMQIPPSAWTSPSPLQLPAPSTTFRLPPPPSANRIHTLESTIHTLEAQDAQRLALLARNDGPCYALRTYGFTAGHDPAEVPRLSSHTTCTPASKSHIRELVKTPSNPTR